MLAAAAEDTSSPPRAGKHQMGFGYTAGPETKRPTAYTDILVSSAPTAPMIAQTSTSSIASSVLVDVPGSVSESSWGETVVEPGFSTLPVAEAGPSVYGEWPTQVTSAPSSTSSLSTVTSIATPSLSRSPSPECDAPAEFLDSIPPTPPALATTMVGLTDAPISKPPPPRVNIPVEQIHLHHGHFFYPPSTIDPTAVSRKNRAGPSNPSIAALSTKFSRKLSFRSNSKTRKDERAASPVPSSSLPAANAPTPPVVETGPAIIIQPPDHEPEQVFRPSLQRLSLMARQAGAGSSAAKHPLAAKSSSASKSTESVASTSSATSTASKKSFLARAKKALTPPTPPPALPRPASASSTGSLPLGLRTPPRSPLPLSAITYSTPGITTSSSASTTPSRSQGIREGGVIVPDPLSPDELDHARLSIAWESEAQKNAREARAKRIMAQREAAAKRIMQAQMAQYRAPFIGF